MSGEKSSKLYVIIIIILVLLIVGIVGLAYNFLFGGLKSETEPSTVSSGYSQTVSDETDEETEVLPENPINFKSLHKKNSEIVAWIRIPDTNINYPVLQSLTADDFYLHRDVNKSAKYAGSIYMEYCNSSEFTDRVTVLYGHNMKDGSMFANLHKFENPDFFKKHRYFYVYTENEILTYEVVSAYNYSDKHIMNSYNFTENKVFKNYLEYILNPRSAVKNVRKKLDHKLTTDDRVLTLSTCLNIGDGRYLLQGVLVKDEYTR